MKLAHLQFKFMILLAAGSLHSSPLASANYKKEWRACKAVKECSLVKGCCGWVTANHRFTTEIKNLEERVCPSLECVAAPDFEQMPQLRCIKNICETKQ
jgi:hypothetical protein